MTYGPNLALIAVMAIDRYDCVVDIALTVSAYVSFRRLTSDAGRPNHPVLRASFSCVAHDRLPATLDFSLQASNYQTLLGRMKNRWWTGNEKNQQCWIAKCTSGFFLRSSTAASRPRRRPCTAQVRCTRVMCSFTSVPSVSSPLGCGSGRAEIDHFVDDEQSQQAALRFPRVVTRPTISLRHSVSQPLLFERRRMLLEGAASCPRGVRK
jgi:hypothetical protein